MVHRRQRQRHTWLSHHFIQKNENYFIERGIFTVMNRMYLVIDRLVQAWVKVVGVLAAHKKRRNPIPATKKNPATLYLARS